MTISHRLAKINELIKQELGKIILEEEEFGPGVLVTPMAVKTSDDLLNSSVIISVFPTQKAESVIKKLTSHVFGLQQLLNKKLKMRPVPKIRFVLDDTESQYQEIDSLLNKIEKQ